MVQILRTVLFLLSLFAVGFAVPNTKRDTVTVTTDLIGVSNDVTSLYNYIIAFEPQDQSQFLAISGSFQQLSTDIGKTASDAKAAGAFSEADGEEILALIQQLEPNLLDALQAILGGEDIFQSLGDTNILTQDIEQCFTALKELATELLAASPDDLVAQAQAVYERFDAAFTATIAALQQ